MFAGLVSAATASAVEVNFFGPFVGVDPLGHPWSTTAKAWGEPALNLGADIFNTANNTSGAGVWATRLGFHVLSGLDGSIDQTPGTYAVNETTTRFMDVTDAILWNTTFIGKDTVIFSAPVGSRLDISELFFVNVVFDGTATLEAFQFTAQWWDDGVVGVDGVPEPAAWALMILGFGAAGLALRGQRRVTFAG